LKEDSFDRIGVDEDVLAGTSGVLRDHPNEFMESRNEVEVILSRSATCLTLSRLRYIRASPSGMMLLRRGGSYTNRKLCRGSDNVVEGYFQICTADVLFLADDVHEPLCGVGCPAIRMAADD
jgi:hypothetical protein